MGRVSCSILVLFYVKVKVKLLDMLLGRQFICRSSVEQIFCLFCIFSCKLSICFCCFDFRKTGTRFLLQESDFYIKRILHECSCFIGFIKRVGKKRYNARLAEHFLFFATSLINSIIQEHEC